MPRARQPADPESQSEALAQLAQSLGLEVPPEDLASLAKQLRLIDALEEAELQDCPPILGMDANWYD